MSDPPRRSTRRNNLKGRDNFAAGDLVEIIHGDKVDQGRLVGRVQEEDPNSGWLVKFDGQELEDAEVLEEDIRFVLARADDSDNSASKTNESPKLKGGKAKTIRNKTQSVGAAVGSGSDSDTNNKRKNLTPSVDLQLEGDPSNVEGSVSSPNSESAKYTSGGEDGKVSSREERSRRRQQLIDEEVPLEGLMKAVAPPPKKSKTTASDEVVKIPMLTGTLYLYRGAKRSVAFIRKV